MSVKSLATFSLLNRFTALYLLSCHPAVRGVVIPGEKCEAYNTVCKSRFNNSQSPQSDMNTDMLERYFFLMLFAV